MAQAQSNAMAPAGRRLLSVSRTLHIYLTMLACLLLLFFGSTGFMLNHGDWFGLEALRIQKREGKLPQAILAPLDRLAVVEGLRSDLGAAGAVDSFEVEEETLRIVFRRPGLRAEAAVRLADGRVELTSEERGIAALLTDLHKGAYAGGGWKWVIDGTAVLLVLGSLTGLILWISLPRRRALGILALSVGLLSSAATYWLLVP
ncbi:MAG TPA: PepSY-associated TM helix domain-containing protein [Planctomycetota bacterium]|nr:PepSY-associated TM helix domain-containing protein [Planctomycetota bacterium]